MATSNEKFVAARRASGKTIAQMTELAGLRSTNTYLGREDDPMQFRLSELKGMYDNVDEIAQSLLRDAVTDIFLPM